jgi:hypothetical protein
LDLKKIHCFEVQRFEDTIMHNWALKLEEIIRYQGVNDLAADAIQGIALTGIAVVFLGWIVMLATI